MKSDDGTIADVEIQSGRPTELEQRAVYYVSRLVSESVKSGSPYQLLPECVVIFFIEGEYFRERSQAHVSFEFCQTSGRAAEREILHPTSPKLHFIEFGKLVSSRSGEYLTFSGLKKKVEGYSADDQLAMQQRAIDEARVAHALEMGGALKRGREEGR